MEPKGITNLTSNVAEVALVPKKSKTGNTYYVLSLTFKDGYCVENFVNRDQLYILMSMVRSNSK